MNSSEHKRMNVPHRNHTVKIGYWINYDDQRKIVDWSVEKEQQSGYDKTVNNGEYVREPIGGRRGFLGFGGRPERSFHEMIAEAVEKAIQWINENSDKHEPPSPEDIAETLEIRGYEATTRDY